MLKLKIGDECEYIETRRNKFSTHFIATGTNVPSIYAFIGWVGLYYLYYLYLCRIYVMYVREFRNCSRRKDVFDAEAISMYIAENFNIPGTLGSKAKAAN